MSQTINSGNVNAILTTNVNNRTALTISEARNGAGADTTVGTVGASKVWRILGMSINSLAAAVAVIATIKLNDVVFTRLVTQGSATANIENQLVHMFDYAACPVVAATQTVKFQTDAAGITNFQIFYVEENA